MQQTYIPKSRTFLVADYDYLINYDIHWNPVRIISVLDESTVSAAETSTSSLEFWPDLTLDDYINLNPW